MGMKTLPLDGKDVSVAISAGYVQMSLRTKDAALAASRHVEADAPRDVASRAFSADPPGGLDVHGS